jgi:hypothetical protein
MTLRLNGSTSGYTEIDAPAVAGSNTLFLPAGNGSAYQVVRNGATAGSLEFADKIVSGTAVASTSGTSIDFTGIPSWVKRVTVNFYNVSTNGASPIIIQIGSSSFVVTAYSSQSSATEGSAVGSLNSGIGFLLDPGGGSAFTRFGLTTITTLGSNTWVYSSTLGVSGSSSPRTHYSGGAAPALSGTLDRVRITTVNGTETFDTGLINILYE